MTNSDTAFDLELNEDRVASIGAKQVLLETAHRSDSVTLVQHVFALIVLGRRAGVRRVCRKFRAAAAAADSSLEAACLWARSGIPGYARKSRDGLERLCARSPDAPLPNLLLAHVLLRRRRSVPMAIAICERMRSLHPSSCLTVATLGAAQFVMGQPDDSLETFNQSGARCRSSFLALHAEMFARFAVGDQAGGLALYQDRNALLGIRSYDNLAIGWIRGGRLAWIVFSVAAGVGAILDNPWFFGIGTLGILAFAPIAWHMTRLARSVILVAAAVVLLWGVYLL
jgi:hypothetical protein